ncbi:hypothetical protein E4K10_18160 [Streptomyces sp. T1317-0309]|nr:hypothetical protein E4K10_18160 [Streptomyces sp. T1317-0309]
MAAPDIAVQLIRGGRGGRVAVNGHRLPGVRAVSVQHEAATTPARVTVEFNATEATVEYVDHFPPDEPNKVTLTIGDMTAEIGTLTFNSGQTVQSAMAELLRAAADAYDNLTEEVTSSGTPANDTAWPPPEWAHIYRQMEFDDAWYSGSRERLANVYSHHNQHHNSRRRSLWGRRSAHQPAHRERRLHVPLAGDIAQTSADLLFADMPAIKVSETNETGRGAPRQVLDEGRAQHILLSGAEQAAALSGVFLRVAWDRNLAQRPFLTTMQADRAMPEYRFGMLAAVNFWRELPGSTRADTWRHIERHEPGRIVHALYTAATTTSARSSHSLSTRHGAHRENPVTRRGRSEHPHRHYRAHRRLRAEHAPQPAAP